MSGSDDMANAEESISKADLNAPVDYRQAAVLSIMRRQRENAKWELIGRLIAFTGFASLIALAMTWDMW